MSSKCLRLIWLWIDDQKGDIEAVASFRATAIALNLLNSLGN
jgi:hypothetical protein